ncbi:hypothetical protein A3N54_02915 [Klebsiella aerogenes]|nr:hypothetical protein A3N54_02915 [Klebsiella aerogenes]
MAMLTGSAGQAVAFTAVIAVAAVTVPNSQENQRSCILYIMLHLPDMTGLRHTGLYIWTVLLAVALRELFCTVFKPRPFCVVLRIELQRTTTLGTAVMAIRILFCRSCTGQATITVEYDKRFCKHICAPYQQTIRRRQPSQYG